MKIDEELIEKVSQLSKLELAESEKEIYSKDFEEILDAFAILDEIDVDSVESSFRPIEERDVMRDDEIEDGLKQEEALKFTRHKEDGFFVGPKTID